MARNPASTRRAERPFSFTRRLKEIDRRTTDDVDFLVTAAGLQEFCARHLDREYERVQGRSRRFRDRNNGVTVDFLVTGRFPGSGKPGPIAFPDPTAVSEEIDGHAVVNLATLVELKLAARRWRDFGDVVELIRFNHLDESFLKKLHPSVHQDFIEYLEEKRREDEYEAMDWAKHVSSGERIGTKFGYDTYGMQDRQGGGDTKASLRGPR